METYLVLRDVAFCTNKKLLFASVSSAIRSSPSHIIFIVVKLIFFLMSTEFYFLNGHLNGNILVHQNFTYAKYRGDDIASNWKCRRGCSVYIKLENLSIVSVSDLCQHSHTNEESEIKILKFKQNVRIGAAKYPHYRPQQLYREELAKWSISERLVLPQYVAIRSTLYEYRKKVLPKLPKSLSQLRIEGTWAETLDGDAFLLYEDGHIDKILVNIKTKKRFHSRKQIV